MKLIVLIYICRISDLLHFTIYNTIQYKYLLHSLYFKELVGLTLRAGSQPAIQLASQLAVTEKQSRRKILHFHHPTTTDLYSLVFLQHMSIMKLL